MKKILLVDDEKLILMLEKKMLERHAYECFAAQNIEDALLYLNSEKINLAILDINLKGESGIDLLKKIKNDYVDVAVIMATGNDDYDTAMSCMRLGADDYLAKPFPEGKLVISVLNVLAKKQLYLTNERYQQNLEENLSRQKEELKASQSLLIQQEKLAAIGQLAAGIAHEINNPLGFISSNLTALYKYNNKLESYFKDLMEIQAQLPAAFQQPIKDKQTNYKIESLLEDLPNLISEMQDGTQRIKKIVEGLKCFSRKDSDTPVYVDINDCLESAITIVWNEIKYNCRLERNFGDIPAINGFPQQLAQVFMNLMVNSSHAIEQEGLIQLETQHDGDFIIVKVSDDGCGIAPENLEKIFDPFFTTKEVGKGTGLGMSIAREIVEKHKGTIVVKSTLGKGTTFTISLPVSPLGGR